MKKCTAISIIRDLLKSQEDREIVLKVLLESYPDEVRELVLKDIDGRTEEVINDYFENASCSSIALKVREHKDLAGFVKVCIDEL